MPRFQRHPRPASPPEAPPVAHRSVFHHDLDALEEEMRAMAGLARTALDSSVRALLHADAELCAAVIAGDDRIDAAYEQVELHAIDIMGRQQPVASDLRLLVAMLHVALNLERIGDMAVDVASATRSSLGLPAGADILGRLQEMGDSAVSMIDAAMDALTERDLVRCEQVAELDDRIDDIHRGMLEHVLPLGASPQEQEWVLRMLQVSRYLERAADHAVDIAEQAWFLTTGHLRELD